jgi:hypothetical protein
VEARPARFLVPRRSFNPGNRGFLHHGRARFLYRNG